MKKWIASIIALYCVVLALSPHSLALTLDEQVSFYEQELPLSDLHSKLVDNEGEGDSNLYGTRNFRLVLNGVQYRGGANNVYLGSQSRNNENPLPRVGLENLCQEGFKTAIYLYTTRFSTAPKTVTCKMTNGESNTLHYLQITAAAKNSPRKILGIIRQAIQTPSEAPIYTHCWNGWHASGLVSALALRQFCGMSATDAVNYWVENTDGQGDGSAYHSIKNEVKNFVPFPDLEITAEERNLICPKRN